MKSSRNDEGCIGVTSADTTPCSSENRVGNLIFFLQKSSKLELKHLAIRLGLLLVAVNGRKYHFTFTQDSMNVRASFTHFSARWSCLSIHHFALSEIVQLVMPKVNAVIASKNEIRQPIETYLMTGILTFRSRFFILSPSRTSLLDEIS